MTTPQFILPFIVQKVEGDEGLAFITDSGDMDTVRCITEEMPLEEAQWLCDRLNASTATASEAARRAAEEIANARRDGEPDFRSHAEYAAWAAAIISKHFPTSKARAALADALKLIAEHAVFEREGYVIQEPMVLKAKLRRIQELATTALRTLPAAQPTGMEDSRAEFEKWIRREIPSPDLRRYAEDETKPEWSGAYFDSDTRMMWLTWQAARQPAAVPEALSSQQAERWVLVPREPTEAMLEATLDARKERCEPYTAERESGVAVDQDMTEEDANYCNLAAKEGYAEIYRAMLSAAPSAPTGEPTGTSETKQHYCREMLKPGGCQLHNLQCGYPDCDKPRATDRLTEKKQGE